MANTTKFEMTREFVDNLQEIINRKDDELAAKIINELHAADIAEIYDELSMDEAKYLFFLIDKDKASDVVAELEDDDRKRFLEALPAEVIARQFIDEMDSDDAADVLADLTEQKQEEVIASIENVEQAGDIVDLLNYDEDTAGGLMAKELIAVNQNWTVQTCIDEIRRQSEEVDEIYYVYVVDDDEKLIGALSLKKLVITPANVTIKSIAIEEVISVRDNEHDEEVAKIMRKYDLVALPVVDKIGRLLGRITIDDIVDVITDEAEKDYQMISGLTEDVESSDSVWMLTRARLPWLFIGLIGGIFGAQVIGIFENDLAVNASLAFFIPLIAAMGGNVGVQSSAIVVQGLAANSIDLDSTAKKILKEIMVASLNGLALSSLAFLYNYIFSNSFALTVTVSVALVIVIIFASVFGTLIPLLLNKFKIDPALATGPFITTVNDIMGLFIYLITSRIIFDIYAT